MTMTWYKWTVMRSNGATREGQLVKNKKKKIKKTRKVVNHTMRSSDYVARTINKPDHWVDKGHYVGVHITTEHPMRGSVILHQNTPPPTPVLLRA